MSSNTLDEFLSKKKAESKYISLEDGESIKCLKLRDIKMFTKPGFDGELKDALRLVVDVETSEGIMTKWFDNSTARFANELRDKKVELGCAFVLTRHGQQTQTRYDVSQVVNASGQPVAPAATQTASPAPAAPSAPAPAASVTAAPVAPATPPKAA